MTHETTTKKARRFSNLWKGVAAITAVAVVSLVLTASGSTEAVPAEDRYETEAATTKTVEEIATGPFTLRDRSAEVSTAVVRTAGVATAVLIEDGDTPRPLDHLMDVNGEPVYALVGGTPFHREITSTTPEGDDIRTLEDNLVAAGYEVGEVDGKADADLGDALKEWQEAEERDETGVFDPASFVWLPANYEIDEVLVEVGGVVGLEVPIVQLRKPGVLVALARIEQNDVTEVRVGLDVALSLDGLPDFDLSGTVAKIDDEAILETSDYLVEVRIDDMPADVREGMRGEVEILVGRHRDVVVVPTGAVGGPAGAPTVRVLAGDEVAVRTIEVGLVTPADTVVVSGVAAGELVVLADREV